MYEYIKGIATEITPTYVVIEAHSIGYMLNISLSTFEEIQRSAGELKMLVHEVIRGAALRELLPAPHRGLGRRAQHGNANPVVDSRRRTRSRD